MKWCLRPYRWGFCLQSSCFWKRNPTAQEMSSKHPWQVLPMWTASCSGLNIIISCMMNGRAPGIPQWALPTQASPGTLPPPAAAWEERPLWWGKRPSNSAGEYQRSQRKHIRGPSLSSVCFCSKMSVSTCTSHTAFSMGCGCTYMQICVYIYVCIYNYIYQCVHFMGVFYRLFT